MKRTILTVILCAGVFAGASSAQRVAERKAAQKGRINEGIKSGELTDDEAAKLKAQERRLNREIRRDRVDGGGLSAAERVKIERKQDKLSKKIYKEKHDGDKKQ